MTDYKKYVVCIPYKTFKERCKIIRELVDDRYSVEWTDDYVVGVKKPIDRRKKSEISK